MSLWGECDIKTCTKGCVTTSWKSCVFPFTYEGRTYTSCTMDDHTQYWCSTENHADGNYKDWGECAMETCSNERSDNRVEDDATNKPNNVILEQLEEISKEVDEMKQNLEATERDESEH